MRTKITQDVQEHFLFPSALFADQAPHRVQTILGSCVAVCLYDTRQGWGGINHYMMPWWNGEGIPSPKYGDVSMELLLKKMESFGSYKSDLVAKVFGGANQHFQKTSLLDIGERNINTAITFLENQHIPIMGQSVGGTQGRKIVFFTGTGQVYMKLLNQIEIKNTGDE